MEQKTNKIRYQDGRTVKTGTVVAFQRSSKHPWKVYLIRPDTGRGCTYAAPNGEVMEVVEVHPDRMVEVL